MITFLVGFFIGSGIAALYLVYDIFFVNSKQSIDKEAEKEALEDKTDKPKEKAKPIEYEKISDSEKKKILILEEERKRMVLENKKIKYALIKKQAMMELENERIKRTLEEEIRTVSAEREKLDEEKRRIASENENARYALEEEKRSVSIERKELDEERGNLKVILKNEISQELEEKIRLELNEEISALKEEEIRSELEKRAKDELDKAKATLIKERGMMALENKKRIFEIEKRSNRVLEEEKRLEEWSKNFRQIIDSEVAKMLIEKEKKIEKERNDLRIKKEALENERIELKKKTNLELNEIKSAFKEERNKFALEKEKLECALKEERELALKEKRTTESLEKEIRLKLEYDNRILNLKKEEELSKKRYDLEEKLKKIIAARSSKHDENPAVVIDEGNYGIQVYLKSKVVYINYRRFTFEEILDCNVEFAYSHSENCEIDMYEYDSKKNFLKNWICLTCNEKCPKYKDETDKNVVRQQINKFATVTIYTSCLHNPNIILGARTNSQALRIKSLIDVIIANKCLESRSPEEFLEIAPRINTFRYNVSIKENIVRYRRTSNELILLDQLADYFCIDICKLKGYMKNLGLDQIKWNGKDYITVDDLNRLNRKYTFPDLLGTFDFKKRQMKDYNINIKGLVQEITDMVDNFGYWSNWSC